MMRICKSAQFLVPAIAVLTLAAVVAPTQRVAAQSQYQPTVLVTGANRGLGLEFARQFAAMDYRVIATARNPSGADELNELAAQNSDVIIERLDVTDHAAIEALGEKLAGLPVDILVNNAGVSGGASQNNFGVVEIDYEAFQLAVAVHAFGPLKMAEVFLPHVMASEEKKIIAVSSNTASLSNAFGGVYIYKASKTALNMLFRTLAMDLKDDGVIVGLITPPRSNTDMQPPGTDRSVLSDPKDSVADMIRNINNFTLENSGSFFGFQGVEIPW